MSIELKQAAQQVVDAFDAFGEDDNFESLFALSQKMEVLRTTIQQATQPAEVTDEQIAACVKRASTYGLPFVGLLNPGGTPSDFSKRFTAEILALRPVQSTFCEYCGGNDEEPVDHCMDCTRPVQVPMTDEAKQKGASYWAPEYRGAFVAGIAWYEQHQGITAQAKKGSAV